MQTQRFTLTPKLQDTLMAIYQFKVDRGCMPTDREVGKLMEISAYAAQDRIYNLENLGYLTACKNLKRRSRSFARSIEYQGQSIPVLGVCE